MSILLILYRNHYGLRSNDHKCNARDQCNHRAAVCRRCCSIGSENSAPQADRIGRTPLRVQTGTARRTELYKDCILLAPFVSPLSLYTATITGLLLFFLFTLYRNHYRLESTAFITHLTRRNQARNGFGEVQPPQPPAGNNPLATAQKTIPPSFAESTSHSSSISCGVSDSPS